MLQVAQIIYAKTLFSLKRAINPISKLPLQQSKSVSIYLLINSRTKQLQYKMVLSNITLFPNYTLSISSQLFIINLMFIGYSPICKGFCLQQSKAQYQKRLHSTRQPHSILPIKTFKTDCKNYILDIQKTWGDFDKSIQSFFSKLRTDLDTIQKKMLMKRLPEQQLKTAINSNDEKLIDLSRKVFNEKYDKLTCQEIHRFMRIKEVQEKNGDYLNIVKREEDLAYDLMDQVKQVVYRLGKELLINRKKVKEEKEEEKMKKKRQDHREERVVNKKETITTSQKREKREDRGERREQHKDRKQDRHQRREDRDQRKREPNRQSDYRRGGKQERPWQREKQAPEYSSKKTQLRIVDLDKNSTDFSIELKVDGFIKSLKEDQVWRARDETGEIKLLIPHIPQIAKGSKVFLSNCFIRQHGAELQLRVRRDSEITIQGNKEKLSVGEFYNSINKRQKRERTFQSQGYPKFTKINDLCPNLQSVKMIAKVLSVQKKDKLIQCVLGDETGIVNARFQLGGELLREKSSIYFRGLQTEVEQDPKSNEGALILIGGRRLLIQQAREPVGNVKFTNNVSDRKYKAVEEDDDDDE